jgi:4-hydroxythreonine-4-phosphate dehydrogenase
MGDPAGIGLEIAIKAWSRRSELSLPPFVLFGDAGAVQERARLLSIPVAIEKITSMTEDTVPAFKGGLPVYHIDLSAAARPGHPDPANAAAIIAAIEHATEAVVKGAASALVTNPIAKHVLQTSGFRYPGHTEFLASLAEHHFPGHRHHAVMMLASDEVRVVPLTVHIPLSDVPGCITRALICDTVRTLSEALRRDFGIADPRIAVTGLNPHAGESGTMGREEHVIIGPAIEELKSEGLAVTGPHPADTLFHAAARASYDAALAMYHDQALIPLKTLAFDTGVNVTLGLPFVRTSPDHGTAFDIAARGCANPDSLIAALRLAERIATNRSTHDTKVSA